jgi:serine/threonine protein kinase
MSFAVADFVDRLGQVGLLAPAQLNELAARRHEFAHPADLTRDLLQRKWLTKYQVEQLAEDERARLVVGPYVLLELLGEGGMGRVYKARHRRLERIVALKVINPADVSQSDAVRRFQREAKAIARLRHPNIVLLYDADEINGLHFLALEYVRGVDLHKLLVRRGPLDVPEACDYVRQAALGLQHAHERGLVHRDVKPANLLLTHDAGGDDGGDDEAPADDWRGGVIKILDLGLARFINLGADAEKLSVDGFVLGTPDYLAPEQALDSSRVDIRADIYSLGCTFYELLTGQAPFAMVSGAQKLVAHIQDEPPSLRTLRAGLPAEVVQVVARMMAKDQAERFQTPSQVAQALADLAAPGSGPATGHRMPFSAAEHVTPSGVDQTGVIRFKAPRAAGPGLFGESPRELLEHVAPVLCAAFSPDGRYALTGGEDPALCLWDMNDARKVRRLAGHDDAVVAVAFAPDSRHAVSAGRDRAVLLWDVEAGRPVGRLRGLTADVLCVAFSPDGRLLLTGGQDMTVALWDSRQQKRLQQLGGLVRGRHFAAVTSVQFTADGLRALSSSLDGTVRMWNLKTGAELHCFEGHKGAVNAVAVSPGGLHLVSGGADKLVRHWGLVSGEELGRYAGHTTGVRAVAFSPDGRHVVSADDHTLRAWELATGRETFRSRDDAQAILCMAVSPDGRQALTGGRDAFLCLWKKNE